eukprot:11010098-Alexandrium_andersonii.AAC.1
MSASLVGSEMCIRDSGTPYDRPAAAKPEPSESGSGDMEFDDAMYGPSTDGPEDGADLSQPAAAA